jgi:hypothetical protein
MRSLMTATLGDSALSLILKKRAARKGTRSVSKKLGLTT